MGSNHWIGKDIDGINFSIDYAIGLFMGDVLGRIEDSGLAILISKGTRIY